MVAAGARTVNFPDTVGFSVPDEYGALIGRMVKALGDTRDSQRALPRRSGLGGREFDCRRAGRRAADRVHHQRHRRARRQLLARRDRDGDEDPAATGCRIDTGIVHRTTYPASQLLSSIITFGPQPNKAIVGENAFAHEAGIHQDGYLKERATYEIIDPKSRRRARRQAGAGQAQRTACAEEALRGSGIHSSTKEELDAVYIRFTAAGGSQERPDERRDCRACSRK